MSDHTSRLVVLEGVDGAGTSTQLQRLARYLRGRGRKVLTCAQPSGGPLGRILRQHLSGELPAGAGALALMFAADRLLQLEVQVLPFLRDNPGGVAVLDRYVLSSLAYQGLDLPLPWVAEINRLARPADLTCFLAVSQATARARRQARGGPEEAFDRRQAEVARAYERALAGWDQPLARVDAEAPVDEVTGALCGHIDALLARPAAP